MRRTLPVCPPEFHLAEFLKKFVPFHGFNDVARSSSPSLDPTTVDGLSGQPRYRASRLVSEFRTSNSQTMKLLNEPHWSHARCVIQNDKKGPHICMSRRHSLMCCLMSTFQESRSPSSSPCLAPDKVFEVIWPQVPSATWKECGILASTDS